MDGIKDERLRHDGLESFSADGDWDVQKKRSPLVMVGALVTGGVLMGGLLAYRSGNKNLSQSMMRARVVAQGVTVALMLGTSGAMAMERGKQHNA
ncbi:hypothetical protein M9434_002899 [Picochlorum sp. BPE23]|nr:hypothetical protein M9434_002899 [Picochlorum sp. BPE23]KAI8104942.1 hypothetical protein M9435_000116 [Picochlorum sp. BPE23]